MTVYAHYRRYGTDHTEECETVDDALRFLAWGEDRGELSTDPDRAVTDTHGTGVATKDDVMRRWVELE